MNPPGLPTVEELVLQERLKLLAIATTVSGAIKAVMVSFCIFHFAFFAVLSIFPSILPTPPEKHATQDSAHSGTPDQHEPARTGVSENKDEAPAVLRLIFGGVALVLALVMLGGWTLGGLLLYSAHCIRKRKHLVFIQIMGAVQCIFVPYGTLIGIFTFHTLGNKRAQALFKAN